MDVGTGLALLGPSQIVAKLLGPTADYLGSGMKEWTEKSVSNVKSIISHAVKKIGTKIDETGSVPPKVLKTILADGPFCDDHVAQEYYGGVLASARTGVSRDDRGAYFLELIRRLTSYQIRAHFILYSTIKKVFNGVGTNVQTNEGRSGLGTYIPAEEFDRAMDYQGSEIESANALLGHVFFGLTKEGLIEPGFQSGPIGHLTKFYPGATEPGTILHPSALGIEFFLSANGKGDLANNQFLNSTINFGRIDGIRLPERAAALMMVD